MAEAIIHDTLWCSGGGNRVQHSVGKVLKPAGRTVWTTDEALRTHRGCGTMRRGGPNGILAVEMQPIIY